MRGIVVVFGIMITSQLSIIEYYIKCKTPLSESQRAAECFDTMRRCGLRIIIIIIIIMIIIIIAARGGVL